MLISCFDSCTSIGTALFKYIANFSQWSRKTIKIYKHQHTCAGQITLLEQQLVDFVLQNDLLYFRSKEQQVFSEALAAASISWCGRRRQVFKVQQSLFIAKREPIKTSAILFWHPSFWADERIKNTYPPVFIFNVIAIKIRWAGILKLKTRLLSAKWYSKKSNIDRNKIYELLWVVFFLVRDDKVILQN